MKRHCKISEDQSAIKKKKKREICAALKFALLVHDVLTFRMTFSGRASCQCLLRLTIFFPPSVKKKKTHCCVDASGNAGDIITCLKRGDAQRIARCQKIKNIYILDVRTCATGLKMAELSEGPAPSGRG